MNLNLLEPLKGCRLESVRVSKGSFTLELEKSDNGNRSLFELSTNGYVIDVSGAELDIDDGANLLVKCLESDVVQMTWRVKVKSLSSTFRMVIKSYFRQKESVPITSPS